MSTKTFYSLLDKEVARIDAAHSSKRNEKVIEGFTADHHALINGTAYHIFNSNDYLGLRFNKKVKEAEHKASMQYGAGPGAVRFIAGTLQVHVDLEKKIAAFHGRDDAMVFSSAFATNVAVISCLIKGQSKDSVVNSKVLVLSDALNHRSIIEGIRVANLPSEQRGVYKHLDYADLAHILESNVGKFDRVVVVTDGIFSMLGEAVDVKALRSLIDQYDSSYQEGVLLVVDDSHGVGGFGQTGRGCEEASGVQADVLVGTLGKAFGTDGGYVVANSSVINYLRESAATYIYSNPISPSVAGSALEAISIVDSAEGKDLLKKSQSLIQYFKKKVKDSGLQLAAESDHPIQPVLIGDTKKTKEITKELFENGVLATSISYPVVPPGRDEIRIQISALHTTSDIDHLVTCLMKAYQKVSQQ